MYPLLTGIMRLLVRVYLAGIFRVSGRELVPLQGGLLVCSNHPSTIDPAFVPAYLPRRDSWSLAKAEWFVRPGFTRWLFTQYHAFPVVRHSADRKAMRRAQEILSQGQALIVYPEGRRVESGVLDKPEPGAAFLAQLTGVPVLPVALVGTTDCFPKGAHRPRRAAVEVRFGAPFHLRQRRADGSRVSREEAADAIMLRIAEMLPAKMRGRYVDLEELRTRVGGAFAEVGQPVS